MNSFPSILKPSLSQFLSLSLSHLDAIFPIYQSFYLSNASLLTPPTRAEEDSDVASDLPGMIGAMLDFVTQACTRKGTKDLWVKESRSERLMEAGMLVAISYAQMTVDDVRFVSLVFLLNVHADQVEVSVGRELGERSECVRC